MPCEVYGCNRPSSESIWPEDSDPVNVCAEHHKKDVLELQDGRTLWFLEFDGWIIAPVEWYSIGDERGAQW
jgi:hypothetical protein